MSSVGTNTWARPSVARPALFAAGRTDAGAQREVNEDRFHVDAARGVFAVIDGVGGQAAGGRAADVALSTVRQRLERETGAAADRIREAITLANNEIHRLASTRAEWNGMACVLTIAIVSAGKVTVGHVGDTRLYRIRGGRLEKLTRDHSPVGEREDAGELTESQAMHHPRRNEVYRDVGSERHTAADPDFIDVHEVPFGPDEALLLCTDGLTDLVESSAVARIVAKGAGNPDAVTAALIDAANAAGGRDNVTVVYVEGEQFASRHWSGPAGGAGRQAPIAGGRQASRERAPGALHVADQSRVRRGYLALAIALLVASTAAAALWLNGFRIPLADVRLGWFQPAPAVTSDPPAPDVQVVQPSGSIAEAIANAPPDSEIVVEPGEYREQIVLKDRVRLISRVPRGAILRLPASAPDSGLVPAVLASGLSRAELAGFRIIGDAATPLGVGIRVENTALTMVDVEISGATEAAVEFSGAAAASLLGSDLHDNPGAAIVIHEGAGPRIAHSVFARNGASERAAAAVVVMKGAAPRFTRNVFLGLAPESFTSLDGAARLALKNENWFVPVSQRRANRGPARKRPQPNR